jgi:multicomponent Na+:H+ antiporter subunit E
MIETAVARWAGFFCLWLVIGPTGVADLLVATLSAAAAAWASLRLLPPAPWRLRLAPLAHLALRFLAQSVNAGTDVARRALAPAMPLRPGFVSVPLRLAPGTARDAFCAQASLLPGTLPASPGPDGALRVHCLDLAQDVRAQMRADEARFLAVLGRAGDG